VLATNTAVRRLVTPVPVAVLQACEETRRDMLSHAEGSESAAPTRSLRLDPLHVLVSSGDDIHGRRCRVMHPVHV
jgi:hypothetical protein